MPHALVLRRLLLVTGLVAAIIIVGFWLLDYYLEKELAEGPISPELILARAESAKQARRPLIRTIGISKWEIIRSLNIRLPLIPEEKSREVMGHKFLTGYNTEDLINVSMQGPDIDLWNLTVWVQLNESTPSSRPTGANRVSSMLAEWLGHDASDWFEEVLDAIPATGHFEQVAEQQFEDVRLSVSAFRAESPSRTLVSIRTIPPHERPTKRREGSLGKPPRVKFHPLD